MDDAAVLFREQFEFSAISKKTTLQDSNTNFKQALVKKMVKLLIKISLIMYIINM